MLEELILMGELKKKTLKKIVQKFGDGIGNLDTMKLSIWDVRNILYDEAKKIAHRELKENYEKALKKW